ncbi:MAG: porin [Mangrovibacterium sp.]
MRNNILLKKSLNVFILSFILLFVSQTVNAQLINDSNLIEKSQFGKGFFNFVGRDSTFSFKFAARFQFLSSVTGIQDQGPQTDFMIRRERLKFDGFVFSPKLTYKLELSLSNKDMNIVSDYTGETPGIVLDALLRWNFYKNCALWLGQTKLPGNVERVTSSGELQFVDRSLLNSKFNIDRGVGFQFRHHFNIGKTFLIREVLALTQGEGRDVIEGNQGGLQYTGRFEILPFGAFAHSNEYQGSALYRESKPKLMLGATYNLNDDAVKTRGTMGTYMDTNQGLFETDITSLFVDAVFKYRGFSLLGEYSQRICDNPIAYNVSETDGSLEQAYRVETGTGLNLQAGYLFDSNWEIAGRYTGIDLDESANGTQQQYTLGISKYLVGHKLKVQTDFSYLDNTLASNEFMARLQVEVHF